MDTTNLQSQKGFTLVEIAIVLVIIGLLLGGVLKGQELIENTKIKAVKGDADAISAAIYGYQDRFRALPGDHDNAIVAAGGTGTGIGTSESVNGTTIVNGNGNGQIEVANGETNAVFAHLRSAGFLAGSGNDNPPSAFGGVIDVRTNNQGIQICQTGLSTEQMIAVDTRFDDGSTNTNAVTPDVTTGSGPDDVGSITWTPATDAVADDAATTADEEIAGAPGVLCIQY